MKIYYQSIVTAICLMLLSNTKASEIIYKPINPSFGGSPLNGAFLLGKAQSQNDHKDNNGFNNDPLSRFQENLQRNILNQLAREVAGLAFGEDGLGDGGTFETNGFSIEIITTNPDMITIRITNTETGEVTIIEVPVFGGG